MVVTGALTGIGASTAEFLVRKGFRVFGGVRREADGERLRGKLGEAFTPLLLDVTKDEAIRAATRRLTWRPRAAHFRIRPTRSRS